jgi:DNA repair protein RadC
LKGRKNKEKEMVSTTYHSMQHLPPQERPRERLVRFGAEALSMIELIAIVLGSGNKNKPVMQLAHELVAHFGGVNQLAEATLEELTAIKGIGLTKAIQLKAAFNLGMRAARQMIQPKYRIEQPAHAYHFIKDILEGQTRELLIVILQNARGYVICYEVVAIGSLSEVIVHPREVFYPAIRHKAASLILVHNHPSGDPTPSRKDLDLTQQLVEIGCIMALPLKDHLIIGRQCYTSLREIGFNFLPPNPPHPTEIDCV